MRQLTAEARTLTHTSQARLASRALDAAPDEVVALSEQLEDMGLRLRAFLVDDAHLRHDPLVAADLCETLIDLVELEGDLAAQTHDHRFDALSRIHAGLARLHELASVAEVLERAPAELCRCCGFDRALVSQVRGSIWVPEVICVATGPDGPVTRRAETVIADPQIRLTTNLLETELARRAAPALVTNPASDPRTHRALVERSRTEAYVAAPVMAGRRVIGFLHADAFLTRRPLTTVDRDNVQTFAEGFGLIFERVVLVERLHEQRDRVRDAFRKAEAYIDEVVEAEVRLARPDRAAPSTAQTTVTMPKDEEPRLHLLLTAREREVLNLMTGGARNSVIADQLAISEGTVKSHVKNICRKLHASNRAEAVSRYVRLRLKGKA